VIPSLTLACSSTINQILKSVHADITKELATDLPALEAQVLKSTLRYLDSLLSNQPMPEAVPAPKKAKNPSKHKQKTQESLPPKLPAKTKLGKRAAPKALEPAPLKKEIAKPMILQSPPTNKRVLKEKKLSPELQRSDDQQQQQQARPQPFCRRPLVPTPINYFGLFQPVPPMLGACSPWGCYTSK